MSSVFLAEHLLIKRRVAMKVLRPELAMDADVIDRFMNEARAAGTLGHPNIVESTDMGFTRDGVPYIVFEYLEGSLLTDEIYRVKGMPVRRAVRIARQIASALSAAHNAGVIHRDLKTDNVFLTDKEEAGDHVKVLDFGISRFQDTDEDRPGTRSMVMGTPQFMAPEQITDPASVDRRVDIYALGVILYEMLTARRPFNNDDTDALVKDILEASPPPLNLPDAPAGLEVMLFTKLLAKDREQRYPTMKDVEDALEAFAGLIREGRASQSIPVATRMDQSEIRKAAAAMIALTPPPPKRSSGAVWLVGALIAGITGGALMYLDGQAKGTAAEDMAQRTTAIQGGVDAIGLAIENTIRSAQMRAEGIAQTPMLRAGVETDAATVRDMVGNDFLFKPGKGEVFELIQVRDNTRTSLLKIPAGGPSLEALAAGEARVASDGTNLVATVATPIAGQSGKAAGLVELQAPVDLEAATRALAPLVFEAKLVGLGAPLVIAKSEAKDATTTTIQLPLVLKTAKAEALEVSIVTRAPGAAAGPVKSYGLARNASWGVGGLLLVVYLLLLLKGRGQR
ncbi:MAG: serine/threonine protein kinase [Deltaproteobacteria bacterium]|nr:serine/threonine protein kinase [Deltaproteobacteria bacterium]